MNIYLIVILGILLGEYVLSFIVETVNIRHAAPELPKEFQGYYDVQKYRQSQHYLVDTARFKLGKYTFFTFLIVVFILTGGFNFIDQFVRSFNLGFIFKGLLFAGILMLGLEILAIPFSFYHTFVIEEKYGFNKTTKKTFVLDILKSWGISAIIGGIVFSGVVWFFNKTGRIGWVYCWGALTFFQLFLMFIAPVVIMPLFNKFTPLPQGELKTEIEDYARREDFRMKGIFTMDGSRRSTRSNAFFTGFGKYKRIALFDTLIQKHTVDELVSVLAHEMGHFKKRHILKMMLMSIFTTGAMLYIFSFFINNKGLFAAFKMEETSIYASIFFFGFLFVPIQLFFSVLSKFFSRHYEYEADAYAVSTYKNAEAMSTALKKLSVDNLSNLTPHPLKVFLDYSHPPVLQRIEAIKQKSRKHNS